MIFRGLQMSNPKSQIPNPKSQISNPKFRSTHHIKALLSLRRGIRELVVAGRNFRSDAYTHTLVQMGRGVRRAQSRETEARRISKSELKLAVTVVCHGESVGRN